MKFTLQEISSKFIHLFPGDQFNKINQTLEEFDTRSLKYSGETVLDKYHIKYITLSDKTLDEESVIVVQITFGRGLFTIFLTIYLTTILVNLIGHSSVFYKDFYFEAQVSLNVTVMLVQVTMFTSVSINEE